MSPRNLRDVLAGLGINWRKTTLDEVRIAYIRKLREAAAGRSDEQLGVNRARRELADAMLKELELAEKYKLIINVDGVEPMLISLMKEIQSVVIEAGNKALQAIETTHELKVDDDLVLGPLYAALGNLAASGDQLVATVSGQPCASVSTATQAGRAVDRGQRPAAGGQ
jgi:hypothetical protein